MPHSSGGGSSHSGSHSGSHSSSGGSSSNPKFGNSYYPGAHRYVYYVNRRPRYYFSDEPYTLQTAESEKKSKIALGSIFSAFGVLALIFVFFTHVHFPTKVNTDYNTEIIIQDTIDVLSDVEEAELRIAFNNFLDQTGITPAFLSIDDDEWEIYADNLTVYAYKTYVDMFPDEKHWLVVYSSNGNRTSWNWEGMIGDDCGGMITPDLENKFTEEVQENLWASSRYTVSSAIISAFYNIAEASQHVSFSGNASDIAPALFGTMVFIGIGIILLIIGLKMDPESDPRINSTQCNTDKEKPKEVKCEYCGGIYVPSAKYTCPHCGAATSQQTD